LREKTAGRLTAETVEDISLHILDIAENSVRAGAKTIEITISRDREHDLLRVEVIDDGRGMDASVLAQVRNPFFTTKHKKTGLGIPLLLQTAEQTGGELTVDSAPGKGTRVLATFGWSHVDRPAIGSMADTLMTLIAGHPELDVIYCENEGGRLFRFDTREIKHQLEDVPISAPEALSAVRKMLQEELQLKQ
jgi:anti-sigma regulatory factor (Ser/Thr protein kinase)